jgi:hypothetical protein
MSTYNRLDLQTLGSQPIMPKYLPDHWASVTSVKSKMDSGGKDELLQTTLLYYFAK